MKRYSGNSKSVATAPTATAPKICGSITLKKPLDEVAVASPEKQTNSATPTPSLNSDSPSIRKEMFFGSPNLLRILVAAIGSVGATMLPNIRHMGSERLSPIKYAAP